MSLGSPWALPQAPEPQLPGQGLDLMCLLKPPRDLGFPGGLVVKNLPPVQEMRVQSLGQEDPMEKEMATHSSILAWAITWTEEPGGLQSMGLQRVGHKLVTKHLNSEDESLSLCKYFISLDVTL